LLSEEIYKADNEFGKSLPHEVLKGYHIWAIPIVKIMRKSKLITKIVFIFARPWVLEMAYRMGIRKKGNFVGEVMLIIGVPICGAIGKIASRLEKNYIFSWSELKN